MNEKERMNKQFIKHTIYNIIAFTIIFLITGLIIYFMFKGITYSTVDNELINTANEYIELSNNQSRYGLNNSLKKHFFGEEEDELGINDFIEKTFKNMEDNMYLKVPHSPKQIVFVRDQDGAIINSEENQNINKDYISSISFNSNDLNRIYPMKIANKYMYRGINIAVTNGDETRYIQILQNVDSENALISHYMEIITIVFASGVVMSIIASYILSKKTLMPISDTLKRQMEFVQNASHELRTPLTIIQSRQELLLQDPNAKIIDKSKEIMLTLNETKRLTKLTKDLMMLARFDENKIEIEKTRIDIDALISSVAEPYVDVAKLNNKELILDLSCKEEIVGDRNKITQVIVIVLDNAIKYTEEGDKIEIKTFSKDGKCVIEIKDTGIGISDEAIKHIFDRFYREDKSRTRETGGSGLGLSIADALIKLQGGTIKASHNSPKGTLFTIKI